MPYPDLTQPLYAYPVPPMSAPIQPYLDQGRVWPPPTPSPNPYQFFHPPIQGQQYYFPPPVLLPPFAQPPRPSSADVYASIPPDVTLQQSPLLFDPDSQEPCEPEEGKGERASRIAQNLRISSRNRSASPQSHRFPVPIGHSSSGDALATLRHSPSTSSEAVGIPIPKGIVHSPRPFLSPKQSLWAIHNSLTKSERVEELERMAEEVTTHVQDLSGDITKALDAPSSYSDKTLPAPPVPSEKGNLLSPLAASRPQLNKIFTIPETVDAAPSDKTPPTPTLTAITPSKQPWTTDLNGIEPSESGLDALERRLLAEVGTRKLDLERRPDVRTVLPIGIPQPNVDAEPLHDSAISSLTLADHDHDSDERTHKAGKSSMSGDDREAREAGGSGRAGRMKRRGEEVRKDVMVAVERDEERKKGKKKERGREGEAHRFRKAAKGRVAAWLGEIDPDVPPPETPANQEMSTLLADVPTTDFEIPEVFTPAPQPPEGILDNVVQQDVSSAPNPRSSGFVPIGTLKHDTFKRHPALKNASPASEAPEKRTKYADLASLSTKVHAKPAPPALRAPPTRTTPAPRPARIVSPSPSQGQIGVAVNGHVDSSPQPESPRQKTGAKPSPRLPAFPPPRRPDPEVKYDIRSARGGRGGYVTAVASIWAAGADTSKAGSDPKPKVGAVEQKVLPPTPVKPPRAVGKSPLSNTAALQTPTTEPPKLVDLAGKRSRPIVKSASVPAIVSSSHATPMLSSTASLVRVTATANSKTKSPIKLLPPTVPESPSEVGKPHVGAKGPGTKSPPGDLAFGQARLRDLIRKYQEQAT